MDYVASRADCRWPSLACGVWLQPLGSVQGGEEDERSDRQGDRVEGGVSGKSAAEAGRHPSSKHSVANRYISKN